MTRLMRGAVHYLRLNRSRDGKIQQLDCFHRFEQAVRGWTIGTRLSPIFGITASPPPNFAELNCSWVFFCGPVYPGDLDVDSLPHPFVSYGLFNIILFCTNSQEKKIARQFVKKSNLFWEEWSFSGNVIEKIDCGGPNRSGSLIPRSMLRLLRECPSELGTNNREYITQIASAVARAEVYLPDYAKELIRFDSICRTIIENNYDSTTKQDILVNTNAALSLYTSQTYSGTTPILETKTRLWNHSLLGVGIASMGLANIRSFIESKISDANIIRRVKALKTIEPASHSLIELSQDNPIWNKDHLDNDGANQSTSNNSADEDPILPLLTFFSGRDGYRTTHFTLSAPLELIGSCNTLSWTLLTITHEISHTVISGILGELLAKPSDDEDRFIPAIRSLSLEKGGIDLFEQVRSLLCAGIWRMSCPANPSEKLTPADLRDYVQKNWLELNEILTSCFDFLYFYRANPEHYIKSLWITWEAIPNIQDRIPEYITRCLCSLHTNNVRRDYGRKTSLIELTDLLTKTQNAFPNLKYTKDALNEVNQKSDEYLTALKERELLVKFVRYFLYSAKIEKILMPDVRVSRSSLTPTLFPRERLRSPLRYIEEVARDLKPDMSKSLGIFYRLAFLDKQ